MCRFRASTTVTRAALLQRNVARIRLSVQWMAEEYFGCCTRTLTTREVVTERQSDNRKRKRFPRSTSPDRTPRRGPPRGSGSTLDDRQCGPPFRPGTRSSSADSSSAHKAASREEDSRNRHVPPMSWQAPLMYKMPWAVHWLLRILPYPRRDLAPFPGAVRCLPWRRCRSRSRNARARRC